MTIDLCLPIYRNLRCLHAMVKGIERTCLTPDNIFIHIQDKAESAAILSIFAEFGFKPKTVSYGEDGKTMADYMNGLLSACSSDWVVMTEQDVFPLRNYAGVIQECDQLGITIAGPVDTLFHDNLNAIKMPKYGQYARISPSPGYFHSALILLKREAVQARSSNPFTVPPGFKFFGYGFLGAEPYYGLRLNCEGERMAFWRQLHAPYGYGALISDSHSNLALHLYYSSRRQQYLKDDFLSDAEMKWLDDEEIRFLDDYEKPGFSL